MTDFARTVMVPYTPRREGMSEKAVEADAARVIAAIGLPPSRQESRRRYPARRTRRLLRVVIPLLGVTLVLVGCQNQSSSTDRERRDGFYGGVTGGWTRP